MTFIAHSASTNKMLAHYIVYLHFTYSAVGFLVSHEINRECSGTYEEYLHASVV